MGAKTDFIDAFESHKINNLHVINAGRVHPAYRLAAIKLLQLRVSFVVNGEGYCTTSDKLVLCVNVVDPEVKVADTASV